MQLRHTKVWTPAAGLLLAAAPLIPTAVAQAPNPVQSHVQQTAQDGTPLYRVEVVGRTTTAINYRHRSGATSIDFDGTALLPKASGEAKVESKQGYIEIEVEFDELKPATQFGPEYLTYVMWAITPEGRATNLGEVLLNGNRSKLDVTTELQSFGLIVTAEPYFAVSQPSDVVVMENAVRPDTRGKVEVVQAKYELLKRGSYTSTVDPSAVTTRVTDPKVPLELYEARNAVQLARFAGADMYAKDTFQKAQAQLQQAETYQQKDAGSKPTKMMAREAVQTAEDSRLIAIQNKQQQLLSQEREAAATREAQAKQQAEQAQANAQQARATAQQAQLNAEQARAQAAAEAQQRQQAQQQAQQAQQQAQIAANQKTAAEQARLQAEQDARQAELQRQQAEADRAAALAARQDAEQQAQQARGEAAKLQQEHDQLRAELQQQLNTVLQTRETARGLIVNMSDVLFDIDKATLKQDAQVKLAKVAGIVLAHPELDLEVDGYTDSTGSSDYNEDLSERRAESVRSFLVEQGVSPSNITAEAFGESNPVASNDTRAGRQRNRRVELVISGESIAATPQADSFAAQR